MGGKALAGVADAHGWQHVDLPGMRRGMPVPSVESNEAIFAAPEHPVEGLDAGGEREGMDPALDVYPPVGHQVERLFQLVQVGRVGAINRLLGERDAVGVERHGIAVQADPHDGPAGPTQVERLTFGDGRADGVDDKVGPLALRERLDRLGHAAAVRIDGTNRTEARGYGEPLGLEVHHHDVRAEQNLDGLLAHQPDGTGPDHDRESGRTLPHQLDDVNAVCQRLGQACRFGRQPFGPREQAARRHGDVLGERAHPMHPKNLALRAEVGLPSPAADARAARDHGVADDAVADGETAHGRADLFDGAAELVPHDEGRPAPVAAGLERLQLAATDPARRHAQQHLVGFRFRPGALSDGQCVPVRIVEGVHGDPPADVASAMSSVTVSVVKSSVRRRSPCSMTRRRLPGAAIAWPGFGASDCACATKGDKHTTQATTT